MYWKRTGLLYARISHQYKSRDSTDKFASIDDTGDQRQNFGRHSVGVGGWIVFAIDLEEGWHNENAAEIAAIVAKGNGTCANELRRQVRGLIVCDIRSTYRTNEDKIV